LVSGSRGAVKIASGSPRSRIRSSCRKQTSSGDLARERHLVGGDEHRHALRLELADRGRDLADRLGVERARDLVEQQRARARGQRAGVRHALLPAAGEPVGASASSASDVASALGIDFSDSTAWGAV